MSATHVYWANDGKRGKNRSLGWAEIEGGAVQQEFFDAEFFETTAWSSCRGRGYVYLSVNKTEGAEPFSSIRRIPLEGGTEEFLNFTPVGVRGVAVDSSYLYWANQGNNAIGRLPLGDFEKTGACPSNVATCNPEFVKEINGDLAGLAVDASHLYWSVNGEADSTPATTSTASTRKPKLANS